MQRHNFRFICVLDFEATCDDKPGARLTQEIIEFPGVLLQYVKQANGKVTFVQVDEFQRYIKPVINPTLTKFCTELTGITQAVVNQGVSFSKAVTDHTEWLASHLGQQPSKENVLFVTCGDWDLAKMLPRQYQLAKSKPPAHFHQWCNLKKVYGDFFKRNVKGMQDMLNGFKLTLKGRHHSGIDDCRNIAEVVKALWERGCALAPTGSLQLVHNELQEAFHNYNSRTVISNYVAVKAADLKVPASKSTSAVASSSATTTTSAPSERSAASTTIAPANTSGSSSSETQLSKPRFTEAKYEAKFEPMMIVGPGEKNQELPESYKMINATSRSQDGWSKGLSPFFLGPVKLYAGYVAQNVENAWQYCKVYKEHVDPLTGEPTLAYWKWAIEGWNNPTPVRFPMGRDAKPLYSFWNGHKLGYIDARKHIYAPLYSAAVEESKAYKRLKQTYTDSRGRIILWDFDGYDYHKMNLTLDGVINNEEKKMGHAFVLAMMLTDNRVWLNATPLPTAVPPFKPIVVQQPPTKLPSKSSQKEKKRN